MNIKSVWNDKKNLIVKLWINQFAFSLFGIFVSSPFLNNYGLCMAAGAFSLLFYFAVVAFAVLDDAQKDKIAYDAGRADGFSPKRGMGYIGLAMLPSFVLTLIHFIIYTFGVRGALRKALYLIDRLALCGEVLGIDVGLAKPTEVTDAAGIMSRVNSGAPLFGFMSDAGLFQLIFVLLAFAVLCVVYALAFKGVIKYNTTSMKKRK